ncbi:MAG TPA: bacillithiol biosynthesis cysteine-adding enzyme BshC [Bacillota bacterium]|nr:bacillithiol biosynthesis cysteine-adding enzyme BshC [Bacillota bacterium]
MQVVEINPIPSSQLMSDYLFNYSKVENYFSYNPYVRDSWQERMLRLSEQTHVNRDKLVEALMAYNKRLNNYEMVADNIEKLRSSGTFVVIGGQQAGLLTGPLYVISKAITLLKLAQEMKEETGNEIVPVFWIASEDHDFAEVNHLFVENAAGEIKKVKLSEKGKPKASVSEISIPSTEFQEAIRCFFEYLPDSPYQQKLKDDLLRMVEQTDKLNDLFAMIISSLFGEHGLILVDSADPLIREMEVPIFTQLIKRNMESILLSQEQKLMQDGYKPQLENLQGNAHFFLHLDQERHLMTWQNHHLISKNGRYRFTQDELKDQLVHNPCLFSANVVSRPIMQEYLFPVAAFVGGPGEIAYWAELKPVFESFGLQMPIVYPRLTFTIIDRNIASYMDRYHLSYEEACYQWEAKREVWLSEQGADVIDHEFDAFKNQLTDLYQPFLESICQVEPGARKLGEANRQRILAHIDFLQRKTYSALEARHQSSLRQWSSIKQSLYPLDTPQERVYNVFGYLNKYGTCFIHDILKQTLSVTANHKLIYI